MGDLVDFVYMIDLVDLGFLVDLLDVVGLVYLVSLLIRLVSSIGVGRIWMRLRKNAMNKAGKKEIRRSMS